MSVTFSIEARNDAEADALASEGAPILNVHQRGAALLLGTARLDFAPYGEIDGRDLLDRLADYTLLHITDRDDVTYVAHRLHVLATIARTAVAVNRRVVWG